MRMEYTKDLLAKGEARKRLTEQLAELVDRVANELSDIVPVGAKVEVGGIRYMVVTLRSNLGRQDLLAVVEDFGGYHANASIFGKGVGEKDETLYLHGDFGAPYSRATREQYLHMANNLSAIIRAFEVEETKIIAELRKGFEMLKALAEAREA